MHNHIVRRELDLYTLICSNYKIFDSVFDTFAVEIHNCTLAAFQFDIVARIYLFEMHLKQSISSLYFDFVRQLVHFLVSDEGLRFVSNLVSIILALQNVRELQTTCQKIEFFAFRKNDFLFYSIGDKSVYVGSDFDGFTQTTENLTLNLVHNCLDLHEFALLAIDYEDAIKVEARANPLDQMVVEEAVKNLVIRFDLTQMLLNELHDVHARLQHHLTDARFRICSKDDRQTQQDFVGFNQLSA